MVPECIERVIGGIGSLANGTEIRVQQHEWRQRIEGSIPGSTGYVLVEAGYYCIHCRVRVGEIDEVAS